MFSFQEKNVSSLSIWGNVLTLQTAHGNFIILCHMFLHPNINFSITKQNKIPKIDPEIMKQEGGIAILRYVLFCAQTNWAL